MKHHQPNQENLSAVPPLRLAFWETTGRCNLSCRHCRRLEVLGAGHLDRLGAGRVDVPDAGALGVFSDRRGTPCGCPESGELTKGAGGGKPRPYERNGASRLSPNTSGAAGELSTAEGAALIDDLARAAPEALLVFSGGEPLLRADLFDLAARARRAGLASALATNGTLVTAELAGRVAAAGFSRASVSLDGARGETHDRLRGSPGLFERALAGLRLLRDAGQAVQINMSVTRAGAGELAEMFALAAREGAAALHIFIIVPVGCGQGLGESDCLGPAEQEKLLREFHALSAGARLSTRATCAPQYARIAAELGHPPAVLGCCEDYPPAVPGACTAAANGEQQTATASPGGLSSEALAKEGAGGLYGERQQRPPAVPGAYRDRRPGGCLAGRAVCFVSHKGEVFPCGYLPVSCGNVRVTALSEVWRTSEVFARLRRVELLGGKCGRCQWRRACGGCRARAFARTGDYLAADPDCVFLPGV